MKKNLAILGVLVLSLTLASAALAGDKCNKSNASSCNTAKTAVAEGNHCPTTAAKAAYASTLESSGCKKTAKAAYTKTMGEVAFANALAESHCSTTAAKATYAMVQEQTGCSATAASATKHAVAQAAYNKCLSETGCEKTADATYEKTAMAVAEEIEKHTAEADEEESS